MHDVWVEVGSLSVTATVGTAEYIVHVGGHLADGIPKVQVHLASEKYSRKQGHYRSISLRYKGSEIRRALLGASSGIEFTLPWGRVGIAQKVSLGVLPVGTCRGYDEKGEASPFCWVEKVEPPPTLWERILVDVF